MRENPSNDETVDVGNFELNGPHYSTFSPTEKSDRGLRMVVDERNPTIYWGWRIRAIAPHFGTAIAFSWGEKGGPVKAGINDMAGEQNNVIRFNDLTENDTVVLETENNVYRFHLEDRNHQMGTLDGGSFREPSHAVLGGTMIDGDQFLTDRLMVGGRILFFSGANEDDTLVRRIVTSPIARMRVDRAA